MDIVESILGSDSQPDEADELALADFDIEDTNIHIVVDDSDIELEGAEIPELEDEDAEDEDGVYFWCVTHCISLSSR